MLKKRFNLRILAAIVACLAVTAVFASCDKDGNDDDGGGGSGKIDQKLVGSWIYDGLDYNYIYKFQKDGNFEYNYRWQSISITEGKFTTSGNKVYFTDIVIEKGKYAETKYPDTVFEYEIGKDDKGDYLKIVSFRYREPYVDISEAIKFRK